MLIPRSQVMKEQLVNPVLKVKGCRLFVSITMLARVKKSILVFIGFIRLLPFGDYPW